MRRRAAATLAMTLALTAAGCGGSDSGDAKKAASDFYDALRGGDGQKACSLMTPEEASSAAGAGGSGGAGSSCAQTIGQIAAGIPAASTKSVKVSGSRATVELSAAGSSLGVTIELEKRGGKWLVSHFG